MYVEPFLRRKREVRICHSTRTAAKKLGLYFLLILVLVAFLLAFYADQVKHMTVIDTAHAQVGPRNNKEACEQIRATKADVRGASLKELRELCANQGVVL